MCGLFSMLIVTAFLLRSHFGYFFTLFNAQWTLFSFWCTDFFTDSTDFFLNARSLKYSHFDNFGWFAKSRLYCGCVKIINGHLKDLFR